MHQVDISYEARQIDAVACGPHHIFVVQFRPPTLHIHNWEGQEVGSVDHQQLGLKSNDVINHVKLTEGDVLHIAVGCTGTVTSLKAFQVRSLKYCYKRMVTHLC